MSSADTPERVQAFKAYLEEQGVNAFLVEAISDLYASQPRPTNALQFLEQRLSETLKKRKDPSKVAAPDASKTDEGIGPETTGKETENY
jgi:hypothetical protein